VWPGAPALRRQSFRAFSDYATVLVALILAAVVSILLAGRFLPAFLKTGKMMPAGMMAILSVIGIVMAILAWMKK
jgi:uncharacterized membrane protein (UPF0136 family)